MNDIKTIEELRVCHERLKGVVMASERLEEWLDAQERKDAQSGTDDNPLHRTPPRSAGVAR
jgi:putative SOS response-associated peptidase YedK